MTGTTSISLSTGGGTVIVPPQSETGIFDEFDPASPIHGSIWFPDSSGIKTYTGNRVDVAIAHRDKVLDDLYAKLKELNDALGGIDNIAPITAVLEAINPDYIPSPFQHFTPPDAPTDIDFSKPPLPVITDIVANFPAQTEYVSQLLTDVQTVLDGMILNLRQTGLNPVIEQQIWDSGRERTAAVMQGEIDSIKRSWVRSGWPLLQGEEAEQVFLSEQRKDDADVTESRNISVAQATLEQKNLQFAIQQAASLVAALGNMHVALQAQLVEAEKARVTTLGEINRLNVEVFKELVEADIAYIQGKFGIYKTKAEVFGIEVGAETSRVTSGIALMKADLEYLAKKVEVDVEVVKANIATLLAKNELLIGGLKAETGLLAQTAASIGGAVSFGAHISGSSSYDNAGPTSLTI